MPLDIDGDGDLDVQARSAYVISCLTENLGLGSVGCARANPSPGLDAPEGWRGLANAFQAEAADLNGDGRLDLVVNVIERAPAQTALTAGLAWLEQPEQQTRPGPHLLAAPCPIGSSAFTWRISTRRRS